jgi:type III pantothenate kinase
MKTLCLDFGNTRQKFAFYNQKNLVAVEVLPNLETQTVEAILKKYQPNKAILSSVINHPETLVATLQQYTQLHILNAKSKLPITTPVGKPETIGADRLALCSAAVGLYSKNHCLVIGLGSCITYNFVNKFQQFLGGSISPGMLMRFKAMNQYTALLPIVPAEHQFPLIGYDTKTNLQSGVLLGIAKEIEGIVNLYQEKYNELKVLLTGGDAVFFKEHINKPIEFVDDLLFKGLLEISLHN